MLRTIIFILILPLATIVACESSQNKSGVLYLEINGKATESPDCALIYTPPFPLVFPDMPNRTIIGTRFHHMRIWSHIKFDNDTLDLMIMTRTDNIAKVLDITLDDSPMRFNDKDVYGNISTLDRKSINLSVGVDCPITSNYFQISRFSAKDKKASGKFRILVCDTTGRQMTLKGHFKDITIEQKKLKVRRFIPYKEGESSKLENEEK